MLLFVFQITMRVLIAKIANGLQTHHEADVIIGYSDSSMSLKCAAALQLREAVGIRPEWFGWPSSKKSLFQEHFHPTCLIKTVFFYSGQISCPHQTGRCKNVDIRNNQSTILVLSPLLFTV